MSRCDFLFSSLYCSPDLDLQVCDEDHIGWFKSPTPSGGFDFFVFLVFLCAFSHRSPEHKAADSPSFFFFFLIISSPVQPTGWKPWIILRRTDVVTETCTRPATLMQQLGLPTRLSKEVLPPVRLRGRIRSDGTQQVAVCCREAGDFLHNNRAAAATRWLPTYVRAFQDFYSQDTFSNHARVHQRRLWSKANPRTCSGTTGSKQTDRMKADERAQNVKLSSINRYDIITAAQPLFNTCKI